MAGRPALWVGPSWRPATLSGPNAASFIAQSHDIGARAAWTRDSLPLLWLYNLHYFDDMLAERAAERREWQDKLVRRWISEHPPAARPGWDPYPTSLRLVNWIKTFWAADAAGRAIIDRSVIHSLAVQARWLATHLEFHLQANHLWANAKALVFAGALFDNAEGAEWTARGAALAQGELREQILHDGGHFERSPMYHAIVLEDVLDLIQLAHRVPGAVPERLLGALCDAAPRMVRWLQVMSHPDGDPAFFNDAAFGIAPRLDVLEQYAHQLGVAVPSAPFRPVEWLKESGYIRLTSGDAVVICDVAPVGPDYQPGHAHADTLSFELSTDRERRIVNSGTSTYERNDLRAWQRSTAAHNTVVVNGANSSDVWAAFRVGRRALIRAVDAGAERGDSGAWAVASHDGYGRGRRGCLHARRWQLTADELVVTDTLSTDGQRAEAYLYFAPHAESRLSVTLNGAGATMTEPSTWYPEFGRAIANTRMRAAFSGRELVTTIRWTSAT